MQHEELWRLWEGKMSRCSYVIYHCYLEKGEGGQLGMQLMALKTMAWLSFYFSESKNRTATSNLLTNDLLCILKTILNFILHIYLILVVFMIIMLTLYNSVRYVSNNILWYSSRIIGNIYFMIWCLLIICCYGFYWILYLYYATTVAILRVLGALFNIIKTGILKPCWWNSFFNFLLSSIHIIHGSDVNVHVYDKAPSLGNRHLVLTI